MAYSGVVQPLCPFAFTFTDVNVTYVHKGNLNVFGHTLLCFGTNIGYIHVDSVYGYPKLIPAADFDRYLRENGKKVLHRFYVQDLSDPAAALAEAERLRLIKWLWLGVPHNCVAFAEQILGKGGSKWTSKTNLPVFSALGDVLSE